MMLRGVSEHMSTVLKKKDKRFRQLRTRLIILALVLLNLICWAHYQCISWNTIAITSRCLFQAAQIPSHYLPEQSQNETENRRVSGARTMDSCLRKQCFADPMSDTQPRGDDDVTVVTAYFNIGPFCKTETQSFDRELYHRWMSAFSRVLNPTIFFTDDREMYDEFKRVRFGDTPKPTCVCLLERNRLWSFQLLPKITKTLSRPNYPKFQPNTLIPEYGSVMHSKYAVLELAANSNPFRSTYFSWMDIGIFRVLVDYGLDYIDDFHLALPADFNRSAVAYCKPDRPEPNFNSSYETYFEENMVWLAGGTFLAEINVMKAWVNEYERFANQLINLGWTSTDQQVLYAMFNQHFDAQRKVNIQVYEIPVNVSPYNWFYLMYVMRHQYLRTKNPASRAPPYDLEVPYKYKYHYYIKMAAYYIYDG